MFHWAGIDLMTRLWWRLWGEPVDLEGAESWLAAPMQTRGGVGNRWVDAEVARLGGTSTSDGGLLESMSQLDSPTFDSSALHPMVADFYEHTAAWRMEVWAGWSPLLRPFGSLVARTFGRRVQQLSIPVDPLSVARGMDSQVVRLSSPGGPQEGAAWIRTLRSTGELVYSGHYTTTQTPASGGRVVHVSFPLESGNVQVFLRPENGSGGSLFLRSPREPRGGVGTYVVVRVRGRHHAARPPLSETFHVFVDDEGVLRTDHELRFLGLRAVRLHYRLERRR